MSSPYADVRSGLLFGQQFKEFTCAHCGEPPTSTVAMALRVEADNAKPSILLAYFLCARCGALYWDEAGKKVMASLKESFD